MLHKYLIILLLTPLFVTGQAGGMEPRPAVNEVKIITDSLVFYNEVHGPFVDGLFRNKRPYRLFSKLGMEASETELLNLMKHSNAVVRSYAFWALSRVHYEKLDSVLLAHAQDDAIIRVIQGRVVSEVTVIDFMQWVVNPDMLDDTSKKLPNTVLDSLNAIRYPKPE